MVNDLLPDPLLLGKDQSIKVVQLRQGFIHPKQFIYLSQTQSTHQKYLVPT